MTDRDRHRLQGPVSSLRIEWTSIDRQTGNSEPAKQGPTFTFDHDGRQEGRVTDEGAMISTVDAAGLRTTSSPYGPRIPRQAGLEYGLCMDANVKIDFLTHYDRNDRPVEVVYRNPEQKAIYRILLEYDDQNRIARESVLYGDVLAGTWCGRAESEGPLVPSPEEVEKIMAEFKIFNPDGVFAILEYEYDARGRVTQLVDRMPPVWDIRRTFAYDGRDNVVEEHYESTSRNASVDDQGRLATSNEQHDESWTRHEYRYDNRGNWIEKVTFSRVAPDRDFHRSSIERRTITYHEPL